MADMSTSGQQVFPQLFLFCAILTKDGATLEMMVNVCLYCHFNDKANGPANDKSRDVQ